VNPAIKKLFDKTFGIGAVPIYKTLRKEYLGISQTDVNNFLKTVPEYQVHHQFQHFNYHNPTLYQATYPLNIIYIDHIDLSKYSPYNKNYKYILTVVDTFSRFVRYFKCKTMTAEETARHLTEYKNKYEDVSHYKIKIIKSDNGNAFIGEFNQWCRNNNIKQIMGASYHPKSQALAESFNRKFRQAMKHVFVETGGLNYVDYLKEIEDSFNETENNQTKYPPYFLMYHTWSDEDIQVNVVQKAENKAKRIIEKSKLKEFEVGDLVRLSLYKMNSAVRKAYKEGSTKDIIYKYSEDVYRISKVIKGEQYHQGLRREQYEVEDLEGNPVLSSITKQASKINNTPPAYIFHIYTERVDESNKTDEQKETIIHELTEAVQDNNTTKEEKRQNLRNIMRRNSLKYGGAYLKGNMKFYATDLLLTTTTKLLKRDPNKNLQQDLLDPKMKRRKETRLNPKLPEKKQDYDDFSSEDEDELIFDNKTNTKTAREKKKLTQTNLTASKKYIESQKIGEKRVRKKKVITSV
jgi:hypothetical protein